MREVRDRLRDLVTEYGHFVDEARGVAVHVEPRFRKEYDAERLVAVIPRLAGCVKSAVDTGQLEARVTAGMVTETELERSGVLTRSLHSRALIVKPLGQRPAGVARRRRTVREASAAGPALVCPVECRGNSLCPT